MKQAPSALITVLLSLKGKRKEKLEASIKILSDSIAQGAWVPRGSVKANSGFYQGFLANGYGREVVRYGHKLYERIIALNRCLCYGTPFQLTTKAEFAAVFKAWHDRTYDHLDGYVAAKKRQALTVSNVYAWVELCNWKAETAKLLNDARPKPTLTAVLLSPKVTKTLKEMDLDIDLPSIKMPKIVVDRVETYIDDKGKERKITWYRIEWEKGIEHRVSRFAWSGGCEACGKAIPSNRFVPVEAIDKKRGGYVSFWLGCDCARNIFGVKDIGLDPKKVVK